MVRHGWLIVVAVLFTAWAGCRKAAEEAAPAPPPPATTIEKVREPAVAGLFYPKDRQDLTEQLDRYLGQAKPAAIKNLRALVCPHAGYDFSAQTAAIGYKQLEGRDIETVVVMAPSHYADFVGASIPDADAYGTPLGTIAISPLAGELAAIGPFVRGPACQVARPAWWRQAPKELPPFGKDTPHTWEHAIEVQLPLLQRVLDHFTLVPIIFGRVDPTQVADALATRLDEKTLVVASSDLSHYYPYDVAEQLDGSCIRAICELDDRWMEGEEACGKAPIMALMHVARARGWKAKLLDYRNSGDVTGDRSAVVGYAAIAFFEPQPGEPPAESRPAPLTPEDGQRLVDLAAQTVDAVVRHGVTPEVDAAQFSPNLGRRRACFVTLTKKGALRGCIGCIFPCAPLWEAVIEKARSAATEDPRFPPVKPEELAELKVEVSVLSLPKRLDFDSPDDLLAKLRPHTDGVVLRAGGHRATYLPQVWDQLPAPAAFLSHLSEKAGLSAAAWRDPEAMVLIYQVQAFKQPET